jgi:hypothetical protein
MNRNDHDLYCHGAMADQVLHYHDVMDDADDQTLYADVAQDVYEYNGICDVVQDVYEYNGICDVVQGDNNICNINYPNICN